MLTFQYRLYPNKKQQELLWSHANELNRLYNYFLNQRIENYKTKTKTTRYTQQNQLPTLKKESALKAQNDSNYKDLLNEIYSQVLQQPIIRLDEAYKKLYSNIKNKKKGGSPKFRSCRNFFGITYPQYPKSGFKIDNNIFKTTSYGKIKFNKTRNITGKIKQASIIFKNNKWYLNIIADETYIKQSPTGEVGIDIGLKTLIVATDGLKIDNTRDSIYFDKQIEKLQSRGDKLKKNSRKQRYLRKVKRRLYEKKVNKINDFQHKVSRQLSSKYDTIYAEDLSVKNMMENNKSKSLNKRISNAKFSQLIKFLGYKCNNLILVNPKNTSKTCNNCGHIHDKLSLSDRTVSCICYSVYDRDENAAKNIFCLGQAIANHKDKQYAELSKMTIQEVFYFYNKNQFNNRIYKEI